MSNQEKALELQARINERALIIYVLESAIADDEEGMHEQYKQALTDEIENHKIAIEDYHEQINGLK